MDFDCLTRKELQFLCKRNKIPANITNVAMADALKALEIVEGIDEFKNQSPEKFMTSTRRKPSKEENQAMQSTIRTRKTARKVPETPVTATNTRRVLKAELGIKDETPLQTGYNTRRSVRLLGKSMTGLSLKENEKVEPVKDDEMLEGEVGNNNGQSELPLVRNLNSSLEDEREKNDDVEEERERDDEKNDEPEGEDKFTDGIVDSKGSDAIAVSEDAHEIENLKPVANETDDVAVSQEGYEIENLKEEMVVDKSTEVLVVNTEASADMEVIDAVSVEENANQSGREIECQKSLEDAHEIENLKQVADETDDIAVSQEGCEIENLKEEMVVDKSTEVLVVNAEASADMDAHEIENLKPVADETDDVAVSEEGCEIENLKEEMVVDKSTEVLVVNAEASADMDVIDAVSVKENANQARPEIECQKSLEGDCEFNAVDDDLTLIPKAEEHADDQGHMDTSAVSQEGCEIENLKEEMAVDKSTVLVVNAEASADMEVIDAASVEENANQARREIECQKPLGEDCEFDAVDDDLALLPKAEEHAGDQGHMDTSAEKRNEESSDDDDSFPDDSDFDDDSGSDSESLADAKEEVSSEDDDDSLLDDLDLDDDTGSDSESLADAQEEVSPEAPVIMVNKEALVSNDEDDTGNEESNEDADAFLDDSDIDNKDPNVTEVGTILVSPFHNTSQSVVDNVDSEALIDVCVKPAEEFAETGAQMSQPTQSSSNNPVLENINKENIDNNTVKKEVDLGLKKVKKNKNLEDLSIRNLKKLLTKQLSKLEITDKNKEDDSLNKDKTNLASVVAETEMQN